MAVTDNLHDFLIHMADAIRIRKGYQPSLATDFASVDECVYNETGYHIEDTDSSGYLRYRLKTFLGHKFVFYVVRNGSTYMLWFVYRYKAGSSASIISEVMDLEDANYKVEIDQDFLTPRLYNYTSNTYISMNVYKLTNSKWANTYYSSAFRASPNGNVLAEGSKFMGTMIVEPFAPMVPHKVDAQDFYDEIINIPYGQEDPEDYGEQVLDQNFSVMVTSGGDMQEPTEETRTITKQFDFTDVNNMYVKWDGKDSGGAYGTCSGSIIIDGTTIQLFAFGTGDGGWEGTHKEEEFSVFDVSSLTGTKNVVFSVTAYSLAGVSSELFMEANINVKEIYLN